MSPAGPNSSSSSQSEPVQIFANLGSGSGGYAENVFRFAVKELFGKELSSNESLSYKVLKNADFTEITYEDVETGETVLR